MAGIGNKPPIFKPLVVEKADAPSDSEFMKMMADIVKRTKERNEELANYEDSDTVYKKWLQDLQATFQPTFHYRNLLGLTPEPKVQGQKQTYSYTLSKDVFVDFAYLAFTRMSGPTKAEDGSHIFHSTNGAIVAKNGKLEFVEAVEAAKDGKKGKGKEFSLEDGYNLVLLAMQDRSMMPPNKMKFHGTPKERAILHYAATQINTLIADKNQQIQLASKNSPKLVLGMISPVGLKAALKDDPFDRIMMDIRNNDTDPNAWKAREEKATQEANAKKAEAAKNKPSATGPSGPKDNGPAPASPSPGSPTPPSGGGAEGEAIGDWDTEPAKGGGSAGVTAAESAPEIKEKPDPVTMAAEAGAGEDINLADTDAAAQKTRPTLPDILGEIHRKQRTLKEAATPGNEIIDPIVTEIESQMSSASDLAVQETQAQEDKFRAQAEALLEHTRKLATRMEKMLGGQSAAEGITAIIESYEDEHQLARNPRYVDIVIAQLEKEKIVVKNPETGEPLFRGQPTFKNRPLDEAEKSDYSAIYENILLKPERFMGVDEKSFANDVHIAMKRGVFLEGRNLPLTDTQRLDMANGMAKRILGYLQEDNVIQMDKDGKISFIARAAAPVTQIFQQAAKAPAQPQPVAQKPVADAQNSHFTSMYAPVNTTVQWQILEDIKSSLPLTGTETATRKDEPVKKSAPLRHTTGHEDLDAQNAIEKGAHETPSRAVSSNSAGIGNNKPFKLRLPESLPVSDTDAKNVVEMVDKAAMVNRLDEYLGTKPIATLSEGEVQQIVNVLDETDHAALQNTDHPEVGEYVMEEVVRELMNHIKPSSLPPSVETASIRGYNGKPVEPVQSEFANVAMMTPGEGATEPYHEGDIAKQLLAMMNGRQSQAEETIAVETMAERIVRINKQAAAPHPRAAE